MLTKLPHRVHVMEKISTPFEAGAHTTSWVSSSTNTTIWASCQIDMTGKFEYGENDKKQQKNRWIVKVRDNVEVTNKNRFVWNDSILTILKVQNPASRKRLKICICEEDTT